MKLSRLSLQTLVFGEDFSPDMLTVTFPVTSMMGDTACADISIIDDDALECSHDFTVAITSATLGTMFSPPLSEATVTILDNDSK